MKTWLLTASFVLLLPLFNISAASADNGDTECKVFIQSASNTITGGRGNHYNVTLAVEKSMINHDDSYERLVGVYYKTYWGDALEKRRLADLTQRVDAGKYYVFTIKTPEGAENHSATAEFSAFLQIRGERLWDNNVGGPYVTVKLDSSNNWRFNSSTCSAK